MKTEAFTFGDGLFADIARSFAARFSWLNDIPTRAIETKDLGPMFHPAWIKAFLWDHADPGTERIVWFDADMVPVAPILDIIEDREKPFAAVLDSYEGGRQVAEWHGVRSGLDVASFAYYFNTGFFIARSETKPVFKALQARANQPDDDPFQEQTALNSALNEKYSIEDVDLLPQEMNWRVMSCKKNRQVRMAHFSGWQPPESKLQVLHPIALAFDAEERKRLGVKRKDGVRCATQW